MIIAGLDKFTTLDYPGKLSALIYTYGCTMRCPFCHNPELVTGRINELNRFTEDEVIEFMKTRIGLLDALAITGGEPTLHPRLVSFMKKVKSLGFEIKLDTYGLNPEILKKIVDERVVDYWAMDVKGDENTYLACGYKGSTNVLDNIEQSIKIIMSSGAKYEFRTTVLKSGKWHTDSLMHNIGKRIAGAKNYYLQNFRAVKTLDKSFEGTSKFSFSENELEEMKKVMLGYVENVGIRN